MLDTTGFKVTSPPATAHNTGYFEAAMSAQAAPTTRPDSSAVTVVSYLHNCQWCLYGMVLASRCGPCGCPACAVCPPGSSVATMESGFSEYALVSARRVLPIPCPAPEVVALLTSGLTASLALEECGGLMLPGAAAAVTSSSSGSGGGGQQRKTVLVTAAAGGTGQFAVQLAKLAGCHVVATCGGTDKAALLKQLGVDRVINYK